MTARKTQTKRIAQVLHALAVIEHVAQLLISQGRTYRGESSIEHRAELLLDDVLLILGFALEVERDAQYAKCLARVRVILEKSDER